MGWTRENRETEASLLRAMREDHAALERALANLAMHARTGDHASMREAFQVVELELREHMEAEERFMLPRFAATHLAEAVDIRHAHALIALQVEDLGMAIELHTARAEMVDALVMRLRAHAAHEERTMYRWADTMLPVQPKHGLFNWLLARFDERLSQGHASR